MNRALALLLNVASSLAPTTTMLAPALLCALAAPSCAPQRTVVLKLHGAEADALVTINDRYVDKLEVLSRRGVALPPGSYRVTVEKVGFFPTDQLVEIDEQPVSVDIELTPIPD